MTGGHKHRVLLVTVELGYAAVTGGGGVARMRVSICSRSDDVVGFSNRRGGPGYQGTAVLTGGVHRHASGWTGLCEKVKTSHQDLKKVPGTLLQVVTRLIYTISMRGQRKAKCTHANSVGRTSHAAAPV